MRQQVTMKLSHETVDNVEWIKKNTGEKNRTQIMGVGVRTLRILIEAIKKGGRVVIEHEDGSKEGIRLIGV